MRTRLHRWRASRLLSFIGALAVLLTAGTPALGHDPIVGSNLYDQNEELRYKFATGTPSWVVTAARTVFETDFPDPNYNNSRMPKFTFDSTAGTHVWFVVDSTSPCSGSSVWLMCADADWNNDGDRC